MGERACLALKRSLVLIALLIAVGMLIGCSGESAEESSGTTPAEPTTAAETTTVTEPTTSTTQQAGTNLPEFPTAPRDAGNPRLRGSQELTYEEFLQLVVTDADAKWQGAFAEAGVEYSPVGFYPFDQSVEACGITNDQEGGPFYCPEDQTIYYPVDWVNPESEQPMSEYGDFAMATVAAHEVGHHAQQQLGIFDEYSSLQTELQADCFAGVWGYSVYYEGLIESGDIDEAMSIAWDSGDLPEQPTGGPGAHGSPEKRVQWFTTGYDNGDPSLCFELTPLPEETTGG